MDGAAFAHFYANSSSFSPELPLKIDNSHTAVLLSTPHNETKRKTINKQFSHINISIKKISVATA